MMIGAEFHSHVSLVPRPPTSYLSLTQAKHLKNVQILTLSSCSVIFAQL